MSSRVLSASRRWTQSVPRAHVARTHSSISHLSTDRPWHAQQQRAHLAARGWFSVVAIQ